MFIRHIFFIASSLAIFGYASAACAQVNTCSNVNPLLDMSGIQETETWLSAGGTFRVEDEKDESKQPWFNLTAITCDKQRDDTGSVSAKCKVNSAIFESTSGKPDAADPGNCLMDLSLANFPMHQIQQGVLTGMQSELTGLCFDEILTIDSNTKRIYMSFIKKQYADKLKPNLCGKLPPTQVLMDCSRFAKQRKQAQGPGRVCDFGGSDEEKR